LLTHWMRGNAALYSLSRGSVKTRTAATGLIMAHWGMRFAFQLTAGHPEGI